MDERSESMCLILKPLTFVYVAVTMDESTPSVAVVFMDIAFVLCTFWVHKYTTSVLGAFLLIPVSFVDVFCCFFRLFACIGNNLGISLRTFETLINRKLLYLVIFVAFEVVAPLSGKIKGTKCALNFFNVREKRVELRKTLLCCLLSSLFSS